MRQLVVLLFVLGGKIDGADTSFIIKFRGDANAREIIEPSIINMFPKLENFYNQGSREATVTGFPPRSVKLGVEIARFKTKVNEEIP